MRDKFFKPYVVALSLVIITTLSTTACTKKTPNTVIPVATNAPAPQNGQQSPPPPPPSNSINTASPQPDQSYPISNYTNLTSGNQLMFLYYALSGMPPDYSKIARFYSQDYRNTSDAFKQQDILKALSPQIDLSISAAKNQRYLIWTENYSYLGHYDFNKKSFLINSPYFQNATTTGYFNDNNGYKIKFMNGTDFAALPVPDENLAKDIESRVSKSQPFNIKIFCFAQNADPSDNSIDTIITRVEIFTQNGTAIASYPAK